VPHAVRRNLDLTYVVMDNQTYGLTKGQLSPTAPRGQKSVTSTYGSIEEPINPLLAVLSYGAPFVAQGTPADMSGLTALVEEAIRYPGFSFVNVRSPCVTFGDEHTQIKMHKEQMKTLASVGHDPADRTQALVLAQQYAKALHTGVFYRSPSPPPTYEGQLAERAASLGADAKPRARVLDALMPK